MYHAVTLDNICRFLPNNNDLPILDAGGGTGIWSVELASRGYRTVLVDISDGMLREASAKVESLGLSSQIQVRSGDIRSMPEFDDAQFSMVLCQGDPLSYCGDHVMALRELVRVLKPGGTLVASVDNRARALRWIQDSADLAPVEELLSLGTVASPQEHEHDSYTVHAFTAEELKGLFEDAGLQVLRIIGKPVIVDRLSCFRSPDPAVQSRLLEIELKYCDDPSYYPWGGHLEIVGRKNS